MKYQPRPMLQERSRGVSRGQYVTFRGSNGSAVTGVALRFRGDTVLVGVQDTKAPYVWVGFGNEAKRVPNNSLWLVPFADITEVGIAPPGATRAA